MHLERIFRATSEVVFCFDGDRAGRDAATKALETSLPMMRDGREARFLFLPEGDDPDSLVRKEGEESFSQRVANASPLSDFLFDHLAGQVDMNSLGGRARLAELAKPLLEKLPKGLFREMMFQRLGEHVGTSVSDPTRNDRPKTTSKRPGNRNFLGTMPPVRRAIGLLISNPGFAQQQALPQSWRNLSLPGITLLAELLDLLRTEPNLTTGAIEERWRGREEARHLRKIAGMILSLPAEEDLAREFADTLQTLDNQYHDQEAEYLLNKAATQGLSGEEKQRLARVLEEKAQRPKRGTLLDEG